MNDLQSLHQRFAEWGRAHLRRRVEGLAGYIRDSHSCWMERPNLYVEHDIGMKNVRCVNGKTRRVRVTKVRDTAGVTFVVLKSDSIFL